MIYFGDVCVGSIGRRAGVPSSAPQWAWTCGFHPGTRPGEQRSGVAETFDGARAAFQAAWQELSATRTEAHYEAWRCQRDWTAWKDRMHRMALPLPTQRPDGVARCLCGEVVSNRTVDSHILAAHRQTAAA
ncbi:hypothetical protein ACVME8_006622 [Bradyrhizobium diazoefficiens]